MELKAELKEALIKNPLSFMNTREGKELFRNLLVGFIQAGEFSIDIPEEEKQEMIDAAVRVKSELG